MSDLNEKLSKSLEEIEALADEILSKSETTEVVEETNVDDEGEIEKGLKPDDVSKDDTKQDPDNDGDVDNKANGEDSDGKDEDEDEDEKEDKPVKKSFHELAEANEELQKGFEVSDFLAEFTRLQGAVIDDLRDDVAKSLQSSTHTATILAKSFNAIMKSQNELAKSLAALQERLDVVERTPVGRKAVVNVMEKSFNASAGIQEPTQELTKSQKLDKLTAMALNGGENGVTINDVVSYESTGQLRPELESIFSKTN